MNLSRNHSAPETTLVREFLLAPSFAKVSSRALPGTTPAMTPVTAILFLLLGLLGPTGASAGEPPVTISGGMDPDGTYRWVVTNRDASPVVSVEFPHYRGDLFQTPPGWKQKCTFLVNVGVPNLPGTCRAWVESPFLGISKGGKAAFELRVRQQEAREGRGTVTVGLADGTTLAVRNVQLPEEPNLLDRFGMLICSVILGGILVIITVRRRRREQHALESKEPDAIP
jgi:hypothetical protein